MRRQNFLKKLGTELEKPTIKIRAIPPRPGTPASVQTAMEIIISPLPQGVQTPVIDSFRTGKPNQCAFCPRSKDKKLNVTCSLCSVFICSQNKGRDVIPCIDFRF